MDFFGAQDQARRSTWRLAALFIAAVVCLVVLTNLLIAVVYGWSTNHLRPGGVDLTAMLAGLPATYWLWISTGVVAVIALASGFRYLQVRSGGRTIAESLGGRLIQHSSDDFSERRLLNVVEEMAIASGIPVPPVYMIDEPSINAFAAGFSPDDAVIGVNRGTLRHLNREELQGVIGHEFSHILNGDSRINLRLIAVLFGILFIGLVGRGILFGVGRGRHRRGRSGGNAPALALGLGMLVIGYAGIFFGNLIKAAVSRQRESLADAAAVQFTRNPAGLAGALKKIGGANAGSTMSSAAAREVSHIFFGQAQRFFLNRLMATHPPLDQRIRAVDPGWDGRFPVVDAGATAEEPGPLATASAFAGTTGPAGGVEPAADPTSGSRANAEALEIHASPDEVVEAIGRLDQTGLDQAVVLIDGLPARLRDAAHDTFAGRALIYALVVDQAPGPREAQIGYLERHAEPGVARELAGILALLTGLDEQQRLTLVDMTVPALKALSVPQYRTFIGNLVTLIKADRRIDLMEWVLHRLLIKELKPHFEGHERRTARHGRLAAVRAEAVTLLSCLAREGGRSPEQAASAFAAGLQVLGLDGELDARDDPNFARLNGALAQLRALKPLQKPRVIKACAATVLADDHVSAREGALLQGIAAALDCPLPPSIYADQKIRDRELDE